MRRNFRPIGIWDYVCLGLAEASSELTDSSPQSALDCFWAEAADQSTKPSDCDQPQAAAPNVGSAAMARWTECSAIWAGVRWTISSNPAIS